MSGVFEHLPTFSLTGQNKQAKLPDRDPRQVNFQGAVQWRIRTLLRPLVPNLDFANSLGT